MDRRQPRGTVRRATVIDAALTLVDERGLHEMTIRALADRLGIGAMTIYTHFARKELLLDAMFARVLERVLDVEPRGTWESDIERTCRHARKVLLAHPHWYPLLARVSVPPTSLRFYDRLLVSMRKAGFGRETAMHAFSSVLGYMLGAVLVERMMSAHHRPPVPVQRLAIVREMLPTLAAGDFPGIAETAESFEVWSFDAVFDVGIRSLIAGLQTECTRGPRGERKRRRA